MTPSHKRNRTKVAGRWVLPGTIIQALDVDGEGTPGPLRVVLAPGKWAGSWHRCAQLLDPVSGRTMQMATQDLTAARVRILSLADGQA